MLKDEFLLMMKQDLETSDDENYKQIYLCFEEILKSYPSSQEIDNSKNCKDCFDKMKSEARKKAKNGFYCFTPDQAKEFIIKYLNLHETIPSKSKILKLEDFI